MTKKLLHLKNTFGSLVYLHYFIIINKLLIFTTVVT